MLDKTKHEILQKKYFGPSRIGDTTSNRLFLYNLKKATEAMKVMLGYVR